MWSLLYFKESKGSMLQMWKEKSRSEIMMNECFIEGCTESVHKSGVCQDHYDNGFFYHNWLD